MAGPPQLPLLSALASCSWPSTPDELASLQSNIHIHLATLLTPTNPPVSPHYLQTSPSTLFRSPPEASPSPPTLHLSFHPPNITTSTTWTRLRIVSTAKNTEVYHADEYCGTAEVVDAVDVNVGGEEWMAYIHELIVDGSRGCVEGCDIKFLLPKEQKTWLRLWSIDMACEHDPGLHEPSSMTAMAGLLDAGMQNTSLNLPRVRTLLHSLDVPISPSAMHLLTQVEQQQQQQQQTVEYTPRIDELESHTADTGEYDAGPTGECGGVGLMAQLGGMRVGGATPALPTEPGEEVESADLPMVPVTSTLSPSEGDAASAPTSNNQQQQHSERTRPPDSKGEPELDKLTIALKDHIDAQIADLRAHVDARFDRLEAHLATLVEILT